MNSHVRYFYRDGANYKAYPDKPVIVAGELPEDELRACLRSGEQFIPGDVGLPELQHQLDCFPSKDDHIWHELIEINFVPGPGSGVRGPKNDDKSVRGPGSGVQRPNHKNNVRSPKSRVPGPNNDNNENNNSEEQNLSDEEARRKEILECGEPTMDLTADELLKRFQREHARGWNERAARQRLGFDPYESPGYIPVS